MISLLSNERECYRCHTTLNLHKHHIYAGGLRGKSDRYGCWVYLCQDCHIGSRGVHSTKNGMIYWNQLKEECQKAFEEKYGHEKFMEEFQRNWIRSNDESTRDI